MGPKRIHKMFRLVERTDVRCTVEKIATLARSRSAQRRLEALVRMRHQIRTGGPRVGYLAVARRLVADPDNDCRWQALIVVGEFIDVKPSAVWQVVRR